MYKKMLAVLMASAMLFVIAGCDFPWGSSSDDNGSTTTEESAVTEESGNDAEDSTENNAGAADDSSDDGAAEDTEEPAEPMEVQEDAELQLDEGQEGAW